MTVAQLRRYDLVNANDAALHFLKAHGVRIKPATIRQWASRRQIGTHSATRRERYDIREIERRARELGWIAG